MKFIELTDAITGAHILINLNIVFTIREGNQKIRARNVVIDFGNDQYIHVKETYEEIKEIIERAV